MPTVNNGGPLFWGSACGSSPGGATLRSDTTLVVSGLFVSAPGATVSGPHSRKPVRDASRRSIICRSVYVLRANRSVTAESREFHAGR